MSTLWPFSGFLKMSIGKLYDSEYNNTVYSGEIKNFNKIKRIPPFKSDNFFRVTRIDNFIKKINKKKDQIKI